MFTAHLICSDPVCDHADQFAGTLEAADRALCEGCGCLMAVIAVEGGHDAEVVDLAAHRARRGRVSRAAGRTRRPPAHAGAA